MTNTILLRKDKTLTKSTIYCICHIVIILYIVANIFLCHTFMKGGNYV